MFKCQECGRLFDTPEEWRETRGEFWGVMSYESLAGCPHCFSLGFEEHKEGENDDDG